MGIILNPFFQTNDRRPQHFSNLIYFHQNISILYI